MKVKIYALIDPLSCKIRYIGRTKNSLNTRLIGHLSKAKYKSTHKECWIYSLIKKGLIPKIKIIKNVQGWTSSYKEEQKLINKAILFGFNLTNSHDRGEGGVNRIISNETKLKISKSLKEKYRLNLITPTRVTKVSIFDLNGIFIKEFNSCSKCIEEINIPRSSLEKVLNKKVKRWKNYQITYGENPKKYVKRDNYSQNNIPIILYNTILMKELKFNSYKDAAKFLNVSSPTIRRYLNKLYKNI